MKLGLGLALTNIYGGNEGNVDPYATNGFSPAMVSDFDAQYFREGGNDSAFSGMFTTTRASNAWYYNASGVRTLATSGVTRIDDHKWNGSAWVEGSLLVEPARTNLERNSTTPAAGSDGNVGVTLTTGQADREGGTTSNLLRATSATSLHYRSFANGQISFTNGTYYCVSMDLEPFGAQRYVTLVAGGTRFTGRGRNVIFDLTGGAVTFEETGTTNAKGWIMPLDNGYYRCSAVFRAASTGTDPVSYYLALTNSPTIPTPSYTGSTSNGVYFEAVQVEASLYPTSLIKTTGSAATRAADVVAVDADAMPAITDEVTIHMRGEMIYEDIDVGAVNNGLSGQGVPFSWYDDTSNYIAAQMETSTGTGAMYFTQENAGTVLQTNTTASHYEPGSDAKAPFDIAMTAGTSVRASVEGTALTESGAGTTPDLALNTMRISPNSNAAMRINLITVTAADVGAAGREEMTT